MYKIFIKLKGKQINKEHTSYIFTFKDEDKKIDSPYYEFYVNDPNNVCNYINFKELEYLQISEK